MLAALFPALDGRLRGMDTAAPRRALGGMINVLHKAAARLKRRASPAEAARARAKRQNAALARAAVALPYLQ